MSNMAQVFSLLFFSAGIIYIYWGIYIIRQNPKEKINRVFLLGAILLSVWSVGYGIGNTVSDIQQALYWRRLAAIGWASVYSAVLHFVILLTYRNSEIKNMKSLRLLYLPALISMYIFSFSDRFADIQYNLVLTDYGWTNISSNNIFDGFFNLYYIAYVLISIFFLHRWKQRLQSRKITRQANLIIAASILTFLLGSFTDVRANLFFQMRLPQMSCIFLLFPVGALYHAARYYGVLDNEYRKVEEIIVSPDEQKNIYLLMSAVISFMGALAFIVEYFELITRNIGNLQASVYRALVIIGIGLGIYMIQQMKRDAFKEILTITILLISIPVVTFQFMRYSTLTVWIFPILIIMSSLLFTKRRLLILTTLMALITQRLVWILRPQENILVDEYDYITRILVIIAIFIIGSYINKIYVAKIKENMHQIEFQKMNADISLDFLSLTTENFNEKIERLLSRCGLFFEADRIYLSLIDYKKETWRYTNEWTRESVEPEIDIMGEISCDAFPSLMEMLKMNKPVYIEDTENIPNISASGREHILRRKIKSLILVPVAGKDNIQGFMGIETIFSKKKWPDDNLKRLNIIGNILASGLIKLNADKKIESMAYNDSLTKLPNRFSFAQKINIAIDKAADKESILGIFFIDLDGFKTVNDTIGHEGGDILLKDVADSLKKSVGRSGIVARFGGDEFMIMLDDIKDTKGIINVADDIMRIFSNAFTINGQDFSVTASAGISVYPQDGQTPEELIKNADIAMYKAKEKGKNQYAFCSQDMKDEVELERRLSADLHHALEKEELVVYYQPQINLNTDEITGAEALIRWNHPQRGMISPAVFIPIAEKNGLINSIGEWVLRTACIHNKQWQDRGFSAINMSVNISVIQFIDPRIANTIENILQQTGMDPKYLELEITESIAIKEKGYYLDILNRLKSIGLSIAIDDFGTEYSSLGRLKVIPIDRIKIDRQFISALETEEKDRAITMTVISLAKNLGLDVLAEGVETENQLEFLKDNMCDHVQGYYHYRPMPSEEMGKILYELNENTGKDFKKLEGKDEMSMTEYII